MHSTLQAPSFRLRLQSFASGLSEKSYSDQHRSFFDIVQHLSANRGWKAESQLEANALTYMRLYHECLEYTKDKSAAKMLSPAAIRQAVILWSTVSALLEVWPDTKDLVSLGVRTLFAHRSQNLKYELHLFEKTFMSVPHTVPLQASTPTVTLTNVPNPNPRTDQPEVAQETRYDVVMSNTDESSILPDVNIKETLDPSQFNQTGQVPASSVKAVPATPPPPQILANKSGCQPSHSLSGNNTVQPQQESNNVMCMKAAEGLDDFLNRCVPSQLRHHTGGEIRISSPSSRVPIVPTVSLNAFIYEAQQILDDSILAYSTDEEKDETGRTRTTWNDTPRNQVLGTVRGIARKHGIVHGKWLLFVKMEHIDKVWREIAQAVYNKDLAGQAKVKMVSGGEQDKLVIGIFTANAGDNSEVMQVLDRIGRLDIAKFCTTRKTYYKLEALSLLGIRSGNKYKLNTVLHKASI